MNLSVQDLANIKQAIELAARRGAFQAGEMKTVGESYDHVCEFLEHIVAQNTSLEDPITKGENYD